jgi:hypothetical protein
MSEERPHEIIWTLSNDVIIARLAESRFSATVSRLQRSALRRLGWPITQLSGRSTSDQDHRDDLTDQHHRGDNT